MWWTSTEAGNFTSIQAAFDAAPAGTPTIIYVKRGLYDKEKLIVPANKTKITFDWQSQGETIISYDTYNCSDGGDGICPDAKVALWTSNTDLVRTAATLTIMANDFRAENITIRNAAGPVGQAQALTLQARSKRVCQLLHIRLSGHHSSFGWPRKLREDCILNLA